MSRAAAYLTAARSAAALIAEPAVAAAWPSPSALPELTVGGLAAHLAHQVLGVPGVLAADPSGVELVALRAHYERAAWVDGDLDSEANAGIRRHADQLAATGPEELAARLTTAIAELAASLPGADGTRRVRPPSGPWALTLDDFLVTRMMEIAVHSDDLAVSAGLAAPQLPGEVLDPVLDLLVGVSLRRHGQAAVLRALSRSERAPATISAF